MEYLAKTVDFSSFVLVRLKVLGDISVHIDEYPFVRSSTCENLELLQAVLNTLVLEERMIGPFIRGNASELLNSHFR